MSVGNIMRDKRPVFVVTFYTTAEAMATEKLCKDKDIKGKLISAPRSLSADCGIAYVVEPDLKKILIDSIEEKGIEVQGYHDIEL